MSILGAGSAWGGADETTWGTAVTPATNWRPAEQGGMDMAPEFLRVASGRISSGFFSNDIASAED